jgi:hypothetical protein
MTAANVQPIVILQGTTLVIKQEGGDQYGKKMSLNPGEGLIITLPHYDPIPEGTPPDAFAYDDQAVRDAFLPAGGASAKEKAKPAPEHPAPMPAAKMQDAPKPK